MKKSSALGMGLDALFEKNDVFDDLSEKKATEKIKLLDIEPNKEQPRQQR